jgi:cation diffusion facilitator family transporter
MAAFRQERRSEECSALPRSSAAEGESWTAVIAALLGNVALAILKAISAAATGSASMLAETFHSVADTGNQALLALGMRLARRPPDEIHPFGHGKNVYFWAFVVSLMLFTLGGAVSLWEGVRKLLEPHEPSRSAWAYGVLAGGFVFESASLAVGLRSLRRARRDRSLSEFWHETRDPTLLTVVLEDTAALASLVVATAGIALAQATGRAAWDALASGLIGLILLAVALALALESYSLLIGERASSRMERRIREAVAADPDVAAVDSLRTMHVGPRQVLAMLEVELRDELAPSRLSETLGRLHGRVEGTLANDVAACYVVIEPTVVGARRRVA